MKRPLPYTQQHIEDLTELHQAFSVDIVLIGAGALMGFIDFTHRVTQDLDVIVSVSVDERGATLRTLKGWSQDRHQEQRWWSSRGLKYDILPAGKTVLVDGEIVWPATKMVMRSVGLDLAFRHREATPHAGIFIAIPPVICVLKMIAFQNRPQERSRDIGDIVAVMRSYPNVDDDQLFEEPFVSSELPFESGRSFLLGQMVARVLTPETTPLVEQFILLLEKEGTIVRSLFVREFGTLDHDEADTRASTHIAALRLGLKLS